MNRIVREHYPVSKLPEDLREAAQGATDVRVTLDVDDRSASDANGDPPGARPGLFSQYRHLRRQNFASDAEVDDYVRALRDEWSDRER